MRSTIGIAACLADPAYRPRALFERFNIEVLCTTDGPADSLEWHQRLLEDGWGVNPATGQPACAPPSAPTAWSTSTGPTGAPNSTGSAMSGAERSRRIGSCWTR